MLWPQLAIPRTSPSTLRLHLKGVEWKHTILMNPWDSLGANRQIPNCCSQTLIFAGRISRNQSNVSFKISFHLKIHFVRMGLPRLCFPPSIEFPSPSWQGKVDSIAQLYPREITGVLKELDIVAHSPHGLFGEECLGYRRCRKNCQVPNAVEMIWSCKHGVAPHVQSSWVLHPFVRACQPQCVGNIWETSLHFWQASGMTHTLFGYIWSPFFPCLSPHLITSASCRNLSNLGFLATTFAPRRSSVTSNMASSNLT